MDSKVSKRLLQPTHYVYVLVSPAFSETKSLAAPNGPKAQAVKNAIEKIENAEKQTESEKAKKK